MRSGREPLGEVSSCCGRGRFPPARERTLGLQPDSPPPLLCNVPPPSDSTQSRRPATYPSGGNLGARKGAIRIMRHGESDSAIHGLWRLLGVGEPKALCSGPWVFDMLQAPLGAAVSLIACTLGTISLFPMLKCRWCDFLQTSLAHKRNVPPASPGLSAPQGHRPRGDGQGDNGGRPHHKRASQRDAGDRQGIRRPPVEDARAAAGHRVEHARHYVHSVAGLCVVWVGRPLGEDALVWSVCPVCTLPNQKQTWGSLGHLAGNGSPGLGIEAIWRVRLDSCERVSPDPASSAQDPQTSPHFELDAPQFVKSQALRCRSRPNFRTTPVADFSRRSDFGQTCLTSMRLGPADVGQYRPGIELGPPFWASGHCASARPGEAPYRTRNSYGAVCAL